MQRLVTFLAAIALVAIVAPMAVASDAPVPAVESDLAATTSTAPALELETATVELVGGFGGGYCIDVIAWGYNPETGECRMFPNPCSVPDGWIIYYNGCPI